MTDELRVYLVQGQAVVSVTVRVLAANPEEAIRRAESGKHIDQPEYDKDGDADYHYAELDSRA